MQPVLGYTLTPTPTIDNRPPTRSKVSGILAAIACAACCALPFLIAAGVITTAGAAVLQLTLLAAVSPVLAAWAAGLVPLQEYPAGQDPAEY